MAIEAVREYMKQWGVQDRILEFEVSSATVELAAQAVGMRTGADCKNTFFFYGRSSDSDRGGRRPGEWTTINIRKFSIRRPGC